MGSKQTSTSRGEARGNSKIFANYLVTGHPIDTGIEIDEASFARLPAFAGKDILPPLPDRTRVVDGYGEGRGRRQAAVVTI